MFFGSRHPRSERIGCRLIGCTLVVLFILLVLCGLAALGVQSVTRTAKAQTAPTSLQLLIFVDQSNSITSLVTTQRLARDVTTTTLAAWRNINSTAHAQIDFFGSQITNILGPKPIADLDWATLLRNRFARPTDLGSTELHRVLQTALTQASPISDVVLITDGLPDPIGRSDDAGRQAYADLLRQMGIRLAERGTRLSVVLIGDVNRGIWGTVWREVASQTGGVFVEARTLADVSAVDQAWAALVPVLTATATPFPTGTPTALPTPSPTRSRAPTQTAVATLMRTEVRTVQPQVFVIPTPAPEPTTTRESFILGPSKTSSPSTRTVSTAPTLLIGLSVLVLMLIGGGFAFTLRVRTRHQQRLRQIAAVPPADEGYIEVYADAGLEGFDDANDAAAQRIELRSRVMGEVLSIGYNTGCDICLPGLSGLAPSTNSSPLAQQENEQAILILTPRGPVIEAREGRLELDGRSVRQHLFFDGDALSLNHCLLSYRNFFRQRPISDTDVENRY